MVVVMLKFHNFSYFVIPEAANCNWWTQYANHIRGEWCHLCKLPCSFDHLSNSWADHLRCVMQWSVMNTTMLHLSFLFICARHAPFPFRKYSNLVKLHIFRLKSVVSSMMAVYTSKLEVKSMERCVFRTEIRT